MFITISSKKVLNCIFHCNLPSYSNYINISSSEWPINIDSIFILLHLYFFTTFAFVYGAWNLKCIIIIIIIISITYVNCNIIIIIIVIIIYRNLLIIIIRKNKNYNYRELHSCIVHAPEQASYTTYIFQFKRKIQKYTKKTE